MISFIRNSVSALRLSFKSSLSCTVLTLLLLTQQVEAQRSLVEATTPEQLNINLPFGREVTSFKISPDDQRIVYIVDQNQDDVFELYSANLDGSGTPTRLNQSSIVAGGDVLSIVGFSADGNRVAYTADQDLDGRHDLFSVNIDGTSRVRLSPNASTAQTIPEAEVSLDGSRVVYILNVGGGFDLPHHIYSVPIAGGTSEILSDRTNDPLQVNFFRFSIDGTKVVFLGRLNVVSQLNIANVDGSGTAIRVDKDSGPDGGVFIAENYRIASDNSHVVFAADKNKLSKIELFSAQIASGNVVKVNQPLPGNSSVRNFRLDTETSEFVYYIAEQNATDREEVFRVKLDGTNAVRISPTVSGTSRATFMANDKNIGPFIPYLFIDRSAQPSSFTLRGISQDSNADVLISNSVAFTDLFVLKESNSGEYITFLVGDSGSLLRRVVSLRVQENATNNRVTISRTDTNTPSNAIREISDNDTIVIFEAEDQSDANILNLYASSLTNGQPVQINPTLPTGADIRTAAISSNGEYAVYIADQSNVGTFNLYSSKITLNDLGGDDLCLPIKANNGFAVVCL